MWGGEQVVSSQSSVVSSQPPVPNPQAAISYTPSHLADRIRALLVTNSEHGAVTALCADLI
jgi:hypothetical protein